MRASSSKASICLLWLISLAACVEHGSILEPEARPTYVPSSVLTPPTLLPGQVAYLYAGNAFDRFIGPSYSTANSVTATLVLDAPLPPNLTLANIAGFAGFSFVITDGLQTLTGVSEALVSTDAAGRIVQPWSFIRNCCLFPNNGVSTVNWPGQRGVFDWGVLSAPNATFPNTPIDWGMNLSMPGTWTMVTGVFDCAAVTQIPQSECEALVALFESTNGPGWTNRTNWLETVTPCSWHGVGCSGGSVTGLILADNQLTGPIPTTFGSLSNLITISLLRNQLTGSIPAELGNLSNLTSLGLDANQLTGSIPAELGLLSNLQTIAVSANQLTGVIPSELGNLASLRILRLSFNQLTGEIPPGIANLTNLRTIELHNNQLTGSIPPGLGNLSDLIGLQLQNNQLTGVIPTSLGNLTQLQFLHLFSNQLTGWIPAELGNLAALTRISLVANQLAGMVPLEVATLGGSIQQSAGSQCSFRTPGNANLFMPDIPAYRQHDANNDGLICGVPFTTDATTLTADMVAVIDNLRASTVVNSGQATALQRKIDQALSLLAKGKNGAAIAVLEDLIQQVEDLMADSVLTPEQGAELIDRAQILIQLL
jgi:hypothetical protein